MTATEGALLLSIPRPALQGKLDADEAFAARFYHALGVFLAARLRNTVSMLGYSTGAPEGPEPEPGDELDEQLLDDLALAGSRFDWILQRLRGH